MTILPFKYLHLVENWNNQDKSNAHFYNNLYKSTAFFIIIYKYLKTIQLYPNIIVTWCSKRRFPDIEQFLYYILFHQNPNLSTHYTGHMTICIYSIYMITCYTFYIQNTFYLSFLLYSTEYNHYYAEIYHQTYVMTRITYVLHFLIFILWKNYLLYL